MPGSIKNPFKIRYIEAPDLKAKLKTKAAPTVVDVREGEEFESGHIPKSIWIPWHTITKKIKGTKITDEIVVYCQAEPRALRAAKMLSELGYKNIIVLRHGYSGWAEENG